MLKLVYLLGPTPHGEKTSIGEKVAGKAGRKRPLSKAQYL